MGGVEELKTPGDPKHGGSGVRLSEFGAVGHKREQAKRVMCVNWGWESERRPQGPADKFRA